jgi:3-hydroxyisobutyrate dehydrogenase-like beta-hydroxyacid dehydrogenase
MEDAVQAEPENKMLAVGYIGLGRMGGPMVDNLLRKGFALSIFDISDAAAAPRAAAGARRCATPRALAEGCDIVFTCLPGPVEARQVYLGDDGLVAGARAGGTFVECTTSSPDLIEELAVGLLAKGAAIIEACVSGGPANSEAGTLVLMLGGEPDVIARAMPALEAVGTKTYLVGGLGAGTTAKLVHNLVFNTSIQVVVEGMALAKKAGIDPATMLAILTDGAYGQGAIPKLIVKRMLDSDDLGSQFFPVRLSYKDLALATQLGRKVGAPLHFAAVAEQNFLEAIAGGFGDDDNRSMAAMIAKRAGLENGIQGEASTDD